MTVVVGVVSDNGVLLAGDAQWSGENGHRLGVEPKVFQLSELLGIAYCGSGRLGQILTYHLTDSLEDPPLGMDEHYWSVREFVPYLRDITEEHGHLHVLFENQVEELGNSAFLFAVRGRLFSVENDFSVNEHLHPYEALGSGEEAAIGSLHASLGTPGLFTVDKKAAEKAAISAIKAAADFTNFVGGKVSKVWTKRHTKEEVQLAKEILSL